MKKIVLDIQSDIHAHTMERMLMQKLDDCQVVISESPDATAEWCKTHRPDVLLMEVKAYSPWMFSERMTVRDKVKRNTENCRVILFVDDDTDGELTEKVRQAKREECTGCHAKRNENAEIPALRDYAVTVTGGTATVAAGTPITRAMEGVEVTVMAQAPDGKHFVKWVVKAGGVTLANETSATTTFIMPANDVTIEAEFAENPVEAYTLTVIKGTASVAAGTPITDKIAFRLFCSFVRRSTRSLYL